MVFQKLANFSKFADFCKKKFDLNLLCSQVALDNPVATVDQSNDSKSSKKGGSTVLPPSSPLPSKVHTPSSPLPTQVYTPSLPLSTQVFTPFSPLPTQVYTPSFPEWSKKKLHSEFVPLKGYFFYLYLHIFKYVIQKSYGYFNLHIWSHVNMVFQKLADFSKFADFCKKKN